MKYISFSACGLLKLVERGGDMAELTRCELNVATVSHRELPTRKNFIVHLILVIYLVLY